LRIKQLDPGLSPAGVAPDNLQGKLVSEANQAANPFLRVRFFYGNPNSKRTIISPVLKMHVLCKSFLAAGALV
jgi:hypothetical protein